MSSTYYTCPYCKQCFLNEQNLDQHKKEEHDDNCKLFNCVICEKTFSTQYNLDKHKIRVHKVEKEIIEYPEDLSMFKCFECEVSFKTNNKLRCHLEEKHGIINQMEEFIFLSYNEYSCWLSTEEKSNNVRYIKNTGVKRKGNIEKVYLDCIRSGKERTTVTAENRKRRKRIHGSCKINKHCTSQVILKRNLLTDECFVQYFKTHYRHDNEIKHLHSAKVDRQKIASKLILGVTPTRILDNTCEEMGHTLECKDLLTRKDIDDIKPSFNIYIKDGVRHELDSVSVDMWVEECKTNESNPILFYKKQGDDSDYLDKNDFCLIIMNGVQIELIKKFGTNVICVDSTHGLNPCDFEMTSILVIDEFGERFPVANMFTNRKDTYVYDLFFNMVQESTGQIDASVFMTDITTVFYKAWEKVMGPAKKQLLCSWHVARAWQLNLSKVSDPVKRSWVYKTLKYLQMLLDVNEFKKQFATFLNILDADESTKRIREYIINFYAQNTEQWAYCYRTKCQINTNMYVEGLHEVLKYHYVDGKKIKRLDKSLHALHKYIRDKTVERIRKLTIGKTIHHENIINDCHRSALVAKFKLQRFEIFNFRVINNEGKQYVVTKNNTDLCCCVRCKYCNVCIHMYECTCLDFCIKSIICQHIHYVCLNTDDNEEVTNVSTTNQDEVNSLLHEFNSDNAMSVNKEEQLKEDIEAVALQIVENVHSKNLSTDQLSVVLKNLKSSVALFDLRSTVRNNYVPLKHMKI